MTPDAFLDRPYTGRGSLTGQAIKLISCFFMLIDHIAVVFIAGAGYMTPSMHTLYSAMRYAGRIAFPLFLFTLLEGFAHTKSVGKYALRLFIFALISELPFDLANGNKGLELGYQNVYFTLTLCVILLWCLDFLFKNLPPLSALLLGVLCVIAFAYFGKWGKFDYGFNGTLALGAAYLLRQIRLLSMAAACAVLFLRNRLEATAFFALIPVALYNGRRGKNTPAARYFFYIFYPAHLLILWALKTFVL